MDDAEKDEIVRIRAQIAVLDAERAALEVRLAELGRWHEALIRLPAPTTNAPNVTSASPTVDKITLFRRLFMGRSDVFPVRWENRKTDRSGYAPACANEWAKGI